MKKKLLRYCINKLVHIERSIEQKEANKIENSWNSKFNGSPYFDHIASSFKIRLFKDSVLSRLIYNGFENDEVSFTANFLRRGDTFFDIGANIGLFSLTASNVVGNEGKIFCFEPSPQTFNRLETNIKLNNFSNITPTNVGLSDSKGFLKLNISDNGYDAWNSFAAGENNMFQRTVDVPVTTLDDFISVHGINHIDLIKIDVEGWEKFVFLGGENYFKRDSPVLMVEFTETNTFSAGYHVQELFDLMEGWGYKWYRIVDNKLVEEKKKLHYPYDNLIATKSLDVILNRVGNLN